MTGGRAGPAAGQQSAYASPAARAPRERRLSQYREPLEHSAGAEQPPASPRSRAISDLRRRAAEVAPASDAAATGAEERARFGTVQVRCVQLRVHCWYVVYLGQDLGRRTERAWCLQESRVQDDYGALLQDSHLLRRDLAQATEDRQIQKAGALPRAHS